MLSYVLELLDGSHDRAGFVSGLDSVDRYLRETARSHMEKGVSVTRVLIKAEAMKPKAVLGYFTLSNITVEAREWPEAPKGLPRQAVSAVLLGRLAVAQACHGNGIGSMLVASARQLARETIMRTGGVGLVVDAAHEEIVGYYARYGFLRVVPAGLRMFLPRVSLEAGAEIQLDRMASMGQAVRPGDTRKGKMTQNDPKITIGGEGGIRTLVRLP